MSDNPNVLTGLSCGSNEHQRGRAQRGCTIGPVLRETEAAGHLSADRVQSLLPLPDDQPPGGTTHTHTHGHTHSHTNKCKRSCTDRTYRHTHTHAHTHTHTDIHTHTHTFREKTDVGSICIINMYMSNRHRFGEPVSIRGGMTVPLPSSGLR